jgi:hypothetical protein
MTTQKPNLESRVTTDKRDKFPTDVRRAIAVLNQVHDWRKLGGRYAFSGIYSEHNLQVVLGRTTGRDYHILVLPVPSSIHIPYKKWEGYVGLEPTYIYSGRSKRVAQRYANLKSKKLKSSPIF